MTYKNKTIKRHFRGNWWTRVRCGDRTICIYGRTQLEVYDKLKIVVDRIEIEKAAKSLERLEQSVTSKTKGYTLQEWFDEWLRDFKIGNVREVTIEQFHRNFKKVKSLHSTRIADITTLMLSKTINEIQSSKMKDAVNNLLKQMFSVAFNNRLIERNPAAPLPRPMQIVKNKKLAFTQDQQNRFIELCMQDLGHYEPFIICVLQGLRKGEMLALRPNDFDFEKDTIRIDESYDEIHPNDLLTKNATSNRIMPMFNLTKQLLIKYKDRDPNERIYTCKTFTIAKRLTKLFKENKDLPELTTHELRHTFISRCHEKGIDELLVQKWVGHAIGSRMTSAVYTHITDDREQAYIKLLN